MEVNCIEPSFSVRLPWYHMNVLNNMKYKKYIVYRQNDI